MRVLHGQRQLKVRDILLWIFAIGVLGYEVWLFTLFLRVPNDQVGVYLGRQIVVKQVSPASQLQAGDVILQVGPFSVEEALLKPGYWRVALAKVDLQHVRYTLLRNGQLLELEVPWRRYSPLSLLWRGGALWLISLALIATTVLLLVERQHELGTWLLGLAFVMLALNQTNNTLLAASASLALQWMWLYIPVDVIAVWFSVSAGLHALLLFPEVKAIAHRFPRLTWGLHLVMPVVSLLVAFLFGGDTVLGVRGMLFDVANPMMLLGLLLQLTALIHTYVTSHRPGVRNQIRWIIWGLGLALLPWLFFYVIPSVLWGAPWLPLSVTSLTMMLIPLSFAVSVFGYRLMDVDLVINRTLVYSVLVFSAVVIYFLVLTGVRRFILAGTGQSNDYAAGIVGALAVFLLVNPLRIYAQNFIDRTFYREKLDFGQVLRDVGEQLSTTIMLRDVETLLTNDIAERLGLAFAGIMLPDEVQAYYVDAHRKTLRIEADSPLIAWLKQYRKPLIVHQRERLPEDVQSIVDVFKTAGGELCLPLFQHNALLGLYVFGSKRSGNLLCRDEVNTLVMLGHQTAAAIQNARFYEELQDYSRLLEARVAARTAELQSERNRLDTILQNIADGLVVTDRNGVVVLVNPAFAQVVDHPLDQILGQPLEDVFSDEGLSALVNEALSHPGIACTANLVDGTNGKRSARVYKASASALIHRSMPGEVFPTARMNLSDMAADVLGVVTVLRDITHEQEVDRMKTDFISMVSHELRTPLTSVLGFAKLIRRNFDREIAPRIAADDHRGQRAVRRVNENLGIVMNEGERLTRLINDLLDIAKMEAGKTEWRITEVSFLEIVEAAVDAMRSLAVQKKMPIVVQVDEDLPPVHADRDRMIQVMTNLLSNALKFTQQGQITVEVRRLNRFALAEPNSYPEHISALLGRWDWLWVGVKDTGIGIPHDKLPEVFEKFKQVTDTPAERPQGTGLGLPICREIIEYHKGRIWVESEVGLGSTFIFMLPLFSEEVPSVVGVKPERKPLSRPVVSVQPGHVILVVDDEAAIRTLLYQELVDAGYQVIEVADGMAALDKARTERPDLILLDVMIPYISGFDVVSVLKGAPETSQIPVVILSAVENRERGFRLGADGYLLKPLDTGLMLDTIADVLVRSNR